MGKTALLLCAIALVVTEASAGNSDPSQAPAICAAHDSDSILVAHEECDKFYKCYQGRPVVIDCPLGLLYNHFKEYCDWPEKVNCQSLPKEGESKPNDDISNVDEGNSNPAEAPALCATGNSDSILIAHEICNKFYKCSENKPVVLDCPQNLLYNIEKEYCDWPENVNCGNRVINDKEDEPSENVPSDSENENSNDGIINSDPSKAPAICAVENSDGTLVAHEDCKKFYKCILGKPAEFDCPMELFYNPKKEYCDWPQNVVCPKKEKESEAGEDKNEELGTHDPSQAIAICAQADSDGTLVAHEVCNKFYICAEGMPVKLDCPANLMYNPAEKICDWPQNVDCDIRTL